MSEPTQPPALEPSRELEPSAAAHYPPPPPIPAEPPQQIAASFRAHATYPLLGPSSWVFGALTWAYVVVGELVVNLGLPEALGVLLVLGSTAYAWALASGLGDGVPFTPKRLLSLGVGLASFALLLGITVSIFGSHRRSHVAAITVLLWFVGVFALLLGRRWTTRVGRVRSTGDRLRSAAIWTLSVIATLIAMISAMDRL